MKNPDDDIRKKRPRIPPGDFNLIEHPFRPASDYTRIEGLTERILALDKQGRLQTALDEILKALDAHPDHPEALKLAVLIAGSSRTTRLQAQEPISKASLADRRLDPIFAICSHCRKSRWVPYTYIFAHTSVNFTMSNATGLQCYNCGYVVCHDCFSLNHIAMGLSIVKQSCPNCHEEQLNVPVFPTGRAPAATPRLATPLARIIIFREGPIPPDGEYIHELLEHISPDALETPGVGITAYPVSSWPDDMIDLAMAILANMEGEGKLPPGSLSSAIYMPFHDKHGIRVYIVKVPQPSPDQAGKITTEKKVAKENVVVAPENMLDGEVEKKKEVLLQRQQNPHPQIEVPNRWGEGDGTPLVVEQHPDLERIFTDPHPPLPQRLTKNNSKYWEGMPPLYLRQVLAAAYILHPDPKVRLATLRLTKDVWANSPLPQNLVDALADPSQDVRVAAAQVIWDHSPDAKLETKVTFTLACLRDEIERTGITSTMTQAQAQHGLEVLRNCCPDRRTDFNRWIIYVWCRRNKNLAEHGYRLLDIYGQQGSLLGTAEGETRHIGRAIGNMRDRQIIHHGIRQALGASAAQELEAVWDGVREPYNPVTTSDVVLVRVTEPFNKVTTKAVTEAIEALFNKALYTLPDIAPHTIIADYEDLKDAWASQALYSGTLMQMRGIVSHNLGLLALRPNFLTFIIDIVEDGSCAQVSALYASTFKGIRLWRSPDRIFVCGSAGFEGLQDAVPDDTQLQSLAPVEIPPVQMKKAPETASPHIETHNRSRSSPGNSRETRQVQQSEQVKKETLYKTVKLGLVYASLIDSICVSIALSLFLRSWLVLGGGILGGLILTGITAFSAKNEDVAKQAIWCVSVLLIFPLAWGYAGWLCDSFMSHIINFVFLPQVLALVGFVAGCIGYTCTCAVTVGEDYSK